jgi:calcineurin-like phosphoesterase
MTGDQLSVIGVKRDGAIERFLSQMPVQFDVADERAALCGVVIELDAETGVTREIFRLTNVSRV